MAWRSFHRAGGVPAVFGELDPRGPHSPGCAHCEWKGCGVRICAKVTGTNDDVILSYDKPLRRRLASSSSVGNLFDSALIKTSVIGKDFRARYFVKPGSENRFEGRAIVLKARKISRAASTIRAWRWIKNSSS